MTKNQGGARPFLDHGEEVQASIIARPRGWTQSMAGGASLVAAAIGSGKAARNVAAANAVFPITSPMAPAVSQHRLLTFKISEPTRLRHRRRSERVGRRGARYSR